MHIVANSITVSPQRKPYLLTIAALALLFAALCVYALFVDNRTGWDSIVSNWVQLHRQAQADQCMLAITMMADLPVSVSLILGLALVLVIERYWWLALYLICTFFSTTLGITIIKFLSQRARPAVSETTLLLMSFPSGHAARAVLVFGLLALLFSWGRRRQTRHLALLVAGIVSLSVAVSRVYLGVHWTSDVLAGAVLAAVMLTGFHWQLRLHLNESVNLPVKWVMVAAVALYSAYFVFNLTAHSHLYALDITG